ncbi:MAG TPA: alpha/beta fold hydrolase [Solirubrobacteraceae bacterium]|nr:alpha/beta fold hydrolase [Solirubrobacteraceae bacterium]
MGARADADVIEAVVIEAGPETVRGHHHLPAQAGAPAAPILLCPAFGWEDMCSYRVRRFWAQRLAEAGHPVLRFDLPGTGDSTGRPQDPELFTAWTEAVSRLSAELASAYGVAEVVAAGIGLGGLLALHAADRGAPIGQAILWGVPSSGRRLLRELRASAALIPPPVGAEPVPGAEGWLELTGYVLTRATSSALSAVALSGEGTTPPRRVLVLGRDGIAVDPSFVARLRAAGADVTLADGMGFGPMMADPERSRIPEETIASSLEWLAGDSLATAAPAPAPGPRRALGAGEPLIVSVAGRPVAEHAIGIPVPGGEVFGVACVAGDWPASGAPLAAVLLNGGAQRHTGQNRNWVEISRRWAAAGVPSVRIDLPGIGDAGGQAAGPLPLTDIYSPERTEQVLAVLAWLREQGAAERFLLSGLCAGAYWAYHAALADPSVAGLGLINLFTFAWSPSLGDERSRRATVRALRGELWRKLRTSEKRREAITRSLRTLTNVRALEQARRDQREHTGRVTAELSELDARGCEVDFLLSRHEALHEELRSFAVLERLPGWAHVHLQEFGWEDHAVRALASQQLVAAWLDRLLARVGATAEPPEARRATTAAPTDG